MSSASDMWLDQLQATMTDEDWAEIDRRYADEDAAYWQQWQEQTEFVPDANAPSDDDVPL